MKHISQHITESLSRSHTIGTRLQFSEKTHYDKFAKAMKSLRLAKRFEFDDKTLSATITAKNSNVRVKLFSGELWMYSAIDGWAKEYHFKQEPIDEIESIDDLDDTPNAFIVKHSNLEACGFKLYAGDSSYYTVGSVFVKQNWRPGYPDPNEYAVYFCKKTKQYIYGDLDAIITGFRSHFIDIKQR